MAIAGTSGSSSRTCLVNWLCSPTPTHTHLRGLWHASCLLTPLFLFLYRNFEESLVVVESPTTCELTGGVGHITADNLGSAF